MNRKFTAIAVTLLGAIPLVLLLRRALGDRPAFTPTAGELPKLLGDVRSGNETLARLRDALDTSYRSTVAAFATQADEAEYEATDAQAQRDADCLQEVFTETQADLGAEFVDDYRAIVERIMSAQLQLMAFAINRKNRGLPDSAQAEAEATDREAFEKDTVPLYARLKATLGKRASRSRSPQNNRSGSISGRGNR